jgi:hypothetical protein
MRLELTALLLLLAAPPAQAQKAPPLLSELASELKSLRVLPVGAPTHRACPANTTPLVGVTQGQLHATLGEPDFIDKEGHHLWWYFFTSPTPSGQMGGGFPQLGFYFDSKKTVTKVDCYYAR